MPGARGIHDRALQEDLMPRRSHDAWLAWAPGSREAAKRDHV